MIIKAVDLPTRNEKIKLLCCEDPLFLNTSTVLSSESLNQGQRSQNASSKIYPKNCSCYLGFFPVPVKNKKFKFDSLYPGFECFLLLNKLLSEKHSGTINCKIIISF